MKTNRKIIFRRKLVAVAVASCFTVTPAFANPIGATVVNGQVGFATQGSTLTVTNSPNSIINWQQFSINTGEVTRFVQQSAQSAVLNRVVGQDPSQLLGSLLSNGRVYLINPSGILFGQGAVIDVGGLVASTLKLSDGDFLAGRLNFTNGAGAAGINNQGSITTPAGGNVYLIAPDITNSGVITSPQGEILLAAGHSVNLMDTTTPNVQVTVGAPDTQAVNIGSLIARSGKVGIYGALIDQQGLVNADTAVVGANGRITLRASKDITLEPGSVTTASGMAGGVKDGGEIRIIADGTLNVRQGSEVHVDGGVDGGNGGFLELSGKSAIALDGTYTGRAQVAGYHGGTLLLDPNYIRICGSSSACSGNSPASLGAGTVNASDSPSGTLYLSPHMTGGGWTNVNLAAITGITVASSIANTDVGGSLTLTAGNNITVNNYVSIGSADSRFAHDLTLRTLNPNSQISIKGNIYLANNTLTLNAPTGPSGGDVGIGSQGTFNPLMVSTRGNMAVSGSNFRVIDGGEGAPTTVSVGGMLTVGTPTSPMNNVYIGRGVSGIGSGSASSNSRNAAVMVSAGSVTVDAASLTVAAAAANSSFLSSTVSANAELASTAGDITLNLNGGGLKVYGGVANTTASALGDRRAHTADATISATGTLLISNGSVTVEGGKARANVGDSSATGNATANALLRGGSVNIINGGSVQVRGGNGASASGSTGAASGVASANANAELSATGLLTINASNLTVQGGSNNVHASANGSKGSATATANAKLHGGTVDITTTGGGVVVQGGDLCGDCSSFARAGSGGKASISVNGELSATGLLTIHVASWGDVIVAGGNGSSSQARAYNGGGAVATANAIITADGMSISTSTATGNLSLTGGTATAIGSGATTQAVALIESGTMLVDVIGNVSITGGHGANNGNGPGTLAFAGIVNTGPINMTIGGATGLTFLGGDGGATYNGWTVPGTGLSPDPTSAISITYTNLSAGLVTTIDPTRDAAFIMTRMSALPPPVLAAVDFGTNTLNNATTFDAFIEPIHFGEEHEDKKNDKPVCR